MMQSVIWKDGRKISVGDWIHIITMGEEEGYDGREGLVTYIDDMGSLHGEWGFLSIIPGDEFEVKHCENK